MHSTLKPKQSDDPHDTDPVRVAPDPVAVAPAEQEFYDLLHDAARRLSQVQARAASDVPAGPAVPPVDTTFRPAAVNDVLASGRLGSIGRGTMRAFAAVLLATCIGLAGVAWEHYGDAAQQMIAQWTPQLALTSLLPQEKPALPSQPAPAADQADATSAPAQSAPPAQAAAPAVAPAAASPADTAQLLQSMARDLASMGQEIGTLKASIEQLKASQQQISREMARASEAKASEAKVSEAKPSEPNLQPRIAAPLPRPAPAPARKLKPKPPPPLAAATPSPPPPPSAASATSRQIEPPPQASAQPQAQEVSPVPRPPMPLTPGIGSFQQ
jgi:hypothetical protein